MSKGRGRTVYRRSDGMWVDERNDSKEPPRVFRTQKEAIEGAGWSLMKEGGGELAILGEGRTTRSKDTVSSGNNPSPPRDAEH